MQLFTERLIIRPLKDSDYKSWLRGFNGRAASFNEFDEGKIDMSICTKDWFNMLIAKHKKMMDEDYQYIFGIFDKNLEHLGMINLVTLERANFQWCELGYSIHNQYWRNGYAYEALDSFLGYVQSDLKFHRVEAHVKEGNTPSANLLIKLGFKSEGIRKKFILEEEWTDRLIFAKVLE
ncbi:GNAT family N-acetyltransferase [Facklamia sp. 7083-14-GEN3]|uniref:GNAT family N-acetyltransferase n=1 Tax=Facklamia sp. 7083-14-GEN3 TaxID=2973478 RepID=UPI00215C5D3D|nr:GNAT family N-acetyltransferase [Facklamia sp. 7083-14-GEN3]MCR8968445.1 GNAT family N-acetyltransferase [Facklamia sp. 7083-14-GEN3]